MFLLQNDNLSRRVMLTSFSVILLLQFIIMMAGAIVASNGAVTADIENDMKQTLAHYDDSADSVKDPQGYAVKTVWNEFQKDFLCCGVDNVTDWSTGQPNNKYNWTATGQNKPEGCCSQTRDGTFLAGANLTTCLKATADPASKDYYFEGCFTEMMDNVDSHKSSMVTVGVITLVFMFVNIIASFGLCMMLTGDV